MKTYKLSLIAMLVQAVKGCNLRCRYCYYDDAEVVTMEPEVFRRVLESHISRQRQRVLHVVFHEGEPLLAGMEYYEQLFRIEREIERKYGVKITNGFVTNGTLINKTWVEFFRKHGCGVTVSIDGPEHLHDRARVFPSGKGSFSEVLRGLRLLKDAGLHTSVLCVLNKENVSAVEEIFSFALREEVTHLGFNPASPSKRASEHGLALSAEEYAEALLRLTKLWKRHRDKVSVNPLSQYLSHLKRGYATGLCRDTGYSGGYAVSVEGELYACHRLLGDKNFLLGSFAEDWFDRQRYEELKARGGILRATKCRACEFARFCNGGCMYNAYMSCGNAFARDCFCPAYRQIFSHLRSSYPEPRSG